MIIVRAPLRIPLGGGGTDLPSYYSQFGGEWISAAIDKYVYVAINRGFHKGFKIRYSKTEEVEKPDQIQHPIFKEAIKLLNIGGGIEIVSVADVPTNTGLGSSGSFTVALLTALHAFLRDTSQDDLPTRKDIAEQACHIAMNLLKEPSGKQDEYISAYGGVNSFFISQNGEVTVEPFYPQKISAQTLEKLENNLLMFYTGIRRESNPVLRAQAQAIENFHRVKEIGREIKNALMRNDLRKFGELLDLHWQEKIKRGGTSDSQINGWYQIAKENGALGGKLMGAGGGGFFLFYCDSQKDKLRKAMADQGLKEQLFHFDMEGAKVIADFK
jgi:D-glycero-alpha-D-manno-heptose-7-phosphate kinase